MEMAYLQNMRHAQRASGIAAVLAIGTANPPNCFSQADFPDFYFQLTDSDHMTQLKAKFKRIYIPGADYQLVKLLGLNPSINSFMISHYGCFAGAAALRLAKDLAENNAGARIPVVCSERILPSTEGAIGAIAREFGMTIYLKEIVAKSIGNNNEKILKKAFDPIGISDWNSIFWVSHPGGPAILKGIEANKIRVK
ncbi:hypothetical protein L6164_016901 [Bauhinia variegata]|uniref:Uncharacterized protein n=1 Tax=Bauhinia variegata TaxID=167791 RepID=A0ACB9N692_BAUVA|nr:hypothetical protein L6164_016901 [Bauhinia variegata]